MAHVGVSLCKDLIFMGFESVETRPIWVWIQSFSFVEDLYSLSVPQSLALWVSLVFSYLDSI